MCFFKNNQRGSIIVLLAVAMTALMASIAIAVDVGQVVVKKAHLQKALDAAALAGVQSLPYDPMTAEDNANAYSAKNGVTEPTVEVKDNNRQIKCSKNLDVPLYFGPALGIKQWVIQASATATVGSARQAGGYSVLPIGILEQELVFNNPYTMKYGGGSGTQGWYGALDITRNPVEIPDPNNINRTIPDGKGANDFEDNLGKGLIDDNSFKLKVGDYVFEEPGNMSGPTRDGINDRLRSCPVHGDCATNIRDWSQVDTQCARFVIIPVLKHIDKKEYQITSFASFYIEGITGNGNNADIKGRFLHTNLSLDSDPTGAVPDYGLTGVKLTE